MSRSLSSGNPATARSSVELDGLALLILLAAVALLVWITIGATGRGPSFDGAMNLQVAWSLSEGEGFRRTYGDREPFPHEIQTNAPYLIPAAMAFKAFGMGFWQAQLANLLYLYALVAVVYLLLRQRFGVLVGATGALLILATPGIIAFGLDGYGEVPALFWCLLALLAFPWTRNGGNLARTALSGLCLGLALCTKTVMAIGVASFGFCCLIALLSDQAMPIRTRLLRSGVLAGAVLLPIAAFELWRWWALGGSQPYQDWWSIQLGAIGQEAGTRTQPVAAANMMDKLDAHLARLSKSYGLPIPALVCWLVGPYLLALAAMLKTRRFRDHGPLFAALLAAAIYFAWWLLLTPTIKAWHRRIFDGSLLLNIGWAYAAGMWIAAASGERRAWLRRLSYAPLAAALLLAVLFFNEDARPILVAGKQDHERYRRAIAILRQLPPEVPVFAIGWKSAPSLSLMAERPFLDFNDTAIARLDPKRPAVLALDTASFASGEYRDIVSMYRARPLLAGDANPQLYELRFDALQPMPGDPAQRRAWVDLSKDDYPFHRGFIGLEAGDRRWMTAEGAIGLLYDGSPDFAITTYAPNAAYQHGDSIGIDVSIDGCSAGKMQLRRALQVSRIRIPDRCRPDAGTPTTVRISADNLVLSPITRDDRRLSVIVGKAGFVPACSGRSCQEWPSELGRPQVAAPAVVPTPATTMIAATPDPIDLCDDSDESTIVEVVWNAPATSGHFEIWVASPGETGKLWHATGPGVGRLATGRWVRDGTIFSLRDGSGKQVASTQVSGKDCG